MAVRESWVFPANGGPPVPKAEFYAREAQGTNTASYAIMPDLPDFVSSVDGKTYSGRKGMREHNLRHNVVPVEDLKGLPAYQVNSDTRSAQERRAQAAQRKEFIINQVNRLIK